jgi:uncharacterized membrane protein YccF (DUF307 family)
MVAGRWRAGKGCHLPPGKNISLAMTNPVPHMTQVNERRGVQAMSLVLNILWIIFGGLYMAGAWVIAAIIMMLTIVGIPWAKSAMTIAQYTLLPFGFKAVPREMAGLPPNVGTGPLGTIGNLIWLLLAGWWLALGHLVTAFLLAITVIGLPFAWAHLKLAGLALWPIGKEIVPV